MVWLLILAASVLSFLKYRDLKRLQYDNATVAINQRVLPLKRLMLFDLLVFYGALTAYSTGVLSSPYLLIGGLALASTIRVFLLRRFDLTELGLVLGGVGLFGSMAWWSIEGGYPWLLFPMAFALAWGQISLLPALRFKKQSGNPSIVEHPYPVLERQDQIANARAYGGLLRPFVDVTSGLRGLLSTAECNAVIAHEIGHLKHHHHLKLAVYLSVLWSLPIVAVYWGDGSSVLLSICLGRPFVEILFSPLTNWLCQLFEFQADGYAVKEAGLEGYVQALKKIWDQSPPPAVSVQGMVFYDNRHPSPSARLKRLGVA